MEEKIMPKAPTELAPGDTIFVGNDKRYLKIVDIRFFEEIYSDTFTPNEVRSNRKWDNLESAEDEIYFVAFIGMFRNVRLNNMTHRQDSLLGTRGTITTAQLTVDRYPDIIPFPLMKWMYKNAPYLELEEMQGLALTDERVIVANGLFFRCVPMSLDEIKAGGIITTEVTG
jgi:hypothetical protein